MSKKWFLLLILFLFGCGGSQGEWERIERSGLLRVGVDPTFPPFANVENEQLVGYEIELAEALGKELGLEIQFVTIGYDGLYDSLKIGRVDALLSALVYRPEMSEQFAYSDAYFDVGVVLVRGDGADLNVDQLEGKRIGVEMGSQAHVAALILVEEGGVSLETFSTPDQLLSGIKEGEVDGGVVDILSSLLYIGREGGVEIVGEPIISEPLHIVVRAEDDRLLGRLNFGLRELKGRGILEELDGRWFGQK